MAKIENFLIGSDFELFGEDIDTGQVKSLVPYIEGTKEEPLSIGRDCFKQLDNILYEANIPPVTNREEFIDYITYCINQGNNILNLEGLKLRASSSETLTDSELSSIQARTFGCAPSFYAYDDDVMIDRNTNLRTAGFHIHIGTKSGIESIEDVQRLMQIMDYNIGLPGITIDPDRVRRQMYGRAGEYRIAERGEYTVVEYRAIGSFFLKNKNLISWIYDQTIKSINDYNDGMDFSEQEKQEMQRAINEYDTSFVNDNFLIEFKKGIPQVYA